MYPTAFRSARQHAAATLRDRCLRGVHSAAAMKRSTVAAKWPHQSLVPTTGHKPCESAADCGNGGLYRQRPSPFLCL